MRSRKGVESKRLSGSAFSSMVGSGGNSRGEVTPAKAVILYTGGKALSALLYDCDYLGHEGTSGNFSSLTFEAHGHRDHRGQLRFWRREINTALCTQFLMNVALFRATVYWTTPVKFYLSICLLVLENGHMTVRSVSLPFFLLLTAL